MAAVAVDEVLCMNGGTGETSYAANSFLQKTGIEKARSWLEESIEALCSSPGLNRLTVADLGCSSGPNALAVLQSIIDAAILTRQGLSLEIPEFNVFMNDLPLNDFNTIFKTLPGFCKKIEEEKGAKIPCFISGTPGSFYGRLFPCDSIQFLHSSYSLHWLSQVPEGLVGENGEALNKGCVYARKGSPPRVLQAYRDQFAKDFAMFLRLRSEELVPGGRMVLSLTGTHDEEMAITFESASQALNKLANEGLIDKAKLDAFNLPFLRPTMQQVKQAIEAEGSFAIHKLETLGIPWDTVTKNVDTKSEIDRDNIDDHSRVSKLVTNTVRGVLEPIFAAEFGEEIMDHVFRLAEEIAMDILIQTGGNVSTYIVVSLIRKP